MDLSLSRQVPVARAPACKTRNQSVRLPSRQVRARATETERDVQEKAAAEIDDAKPSGIGQPGGNGKPSGNGTPSIEGLDAATEEKGKRLAKVLAAVALYQDFGRTSQPCRVVLETSWASVKGPKYQSGCQSYSNLSIGENILTSNVVLT